MSETTSKKVLRKSKGKWVVALLVSATIGGAALSMEPVRAELNESAMQVMRSISSAEFEGKDDVLADESIQNESNTALEEITANWERNTVSEIQSEIERQKDLGLNAYVVQWGDTLGVLAEATDKSVDEIAHANNIENDDLILTGDILHNVLTDIEGFDQSPSQPETDEAAASPNENQSSSSSIENSDGNTVSDYQEDQLGDPLVGTNENTPADESTADNTDEQSTNDDSSENTNNNEDNLTSSEQPSNETNDENANDQPENENSTDESGNDSGDDTDETPTEGNTDDVVEDSTDQSANEAPSEDEETEMTTEIIEEPEAIPFATEEVGNDQLEQGTEQVIQEGTDGERINYVEVTYNENGEEVARGTVDSAISVEPTSQITEVGTEQVEYEEATEEVAIPYETEYRENENTEAGESTIIQEGQNGLKEVTYQQKYVNGEFDSSEPISKEVISEPVNEIIEIGTATPEVSTETDTVTETISFETETRENPELPAGTEQVVQEGQNGSVTTTYNVTYENGQEVDRQQAGEPVRQEPVNQIVEVGTAQQEAPAEETSTPVENIKYGVEAGDTFYSISQKFGTTPEAIASASGITVNTPLSPGDTLTIPSAEAEPMDNAQAQDGENVVMLDAGHGGGDTGANYSGTSEKDLNLNLAQQLTAELQNRGFEVINTRSGDIQVSLDGRSQQANDSNADIFISLHHNALDGSTDGIETYYYEYNTAYPSTQNQANHNNGQRITNSKHLADLIQNNLVSATGADDRGVQTSTFAVTRETDVPAVLVEYGFMDNPEEYANLTNAEYQTALTQAVANAVETYFANVH